MSAIAMEEEGPPQDNDPPPLDDSPDPETNQSQAPVLSFASARGLFDIGTGKNVIPLPVVPVGTPARIGRPRKRPLPPPPTPWRSIIEAYKKEAVLNGLPIDVINDIWDAIEKPGPKKGKKFSAALKAEFVPVMIPAAELPPDLIERMLNWLIHAVAESFTLGKLETTVMMYFVGMVEYNFIDTKVFSEPFYFKMLSSMRRQDGLIPLICLLLRFVVDSSLLDKSTIKDLASFYKCGLIIPAMRSVDELLRIYKSIRPGLFPKNVLKMRMASTRKEADLLDQEFRRRLFKSQTRLTGRRIYFGENVVASHPVPPSTDEADVFFPEFRPTVDFSNGTRVKFDELSIPDRMHCFLRLEETTPMLLQDGRVLQRFFSWVDLILKHKFELYNAKQHHRYEFILNRCCLITMLSDTSIPPVESWILDNFLDWGGTVLRGQIYFLLSYSSIIDFTGEYSYILDRLEEDFLDGSLPRRIEIWDLLCQWFNRWHKAILSEEKELSTEGEDEDDGRRLRVATGFMRRLHEFMHKILGKYAALYPVGQNLMILHFIDKYDMLLDQYIESNETWLIQPFPPVALWHLVLTSNSLIILNSFCGFALKLSSLNLGDKVDIPGIKDGILVFTEVCKFFCTSPLRRIFKAECSILKRKVPKDQRPVPGPVRASDPNEPFVRPKQPKEKPIDKEIREFLRKVADYSCYTCDCLQDYQIFKKGNHKHSKFDVEKLKEDAPFVATVMTEMQNRVMERADTEVMSQNNTLDLL